MEAVEHIADKDPVIAFWGKAALGRFRVKGDEAFVVPYVIVGPPFGGYEQPWRQFVFGNLTDQHLLVETDKNLACHVLGGLFMIQDVVGGIKDTLLILGIIFPEIGIYLIQYCHLYEIGVRGNLRCFW